MAKTPEEVEDGVMDVLVTLDAEQIEEICGLVNVVIADDLKGNKREMKKLLMKHLCTISADDDKLADFLAIHTHLKIGEEEEDDGSFDEEEEEDTEENEDPLSSSSSDEDTANVKQEDGATRLQSKKANKGKSVSKGKIMKKNGTSKKKGTSGKQGNPKKSKGKTSVSESEEEVEIRRVRVAKDFKLPGMIGGDGENAMSYSSLEFEIAKGRTLGFTDPEMCSTVISKTADKELRSFFENEEGMELNDVLEMLKAVCTVKESSTLLTEFTTDKQGPNEKPITFITRVLRLQNVRKKGKEEGIHYNKEMLAKRSFQVIFGGLRDENIRTALREQTKNNHKLSFKAVFLLANNVIQAEDERKKKLFPKKSTESKNDTEDVDINVMDAGNRDFGAHRKKEKRDPFVEIDRLRTELKESQNEIKDLFLEFKKEYLNKKDNKEGKPPRKQANRCPNCVAANVARCVGHCWQCGQSDHRMKDCPEN